MRTLIDNVKQGCCGWHSFAASLRAGLNTLMTSTVTWWTPVEGSPAPQTLLGPDRHLLGKTEGAQAKIKAMTYQFPLSSWRSS
jgi:hypothetical protein